MADDVRITWNGAQAKQQIRRGAARGVRRAGQDVLDASLRVVPREDDELAGSAALDVDDTDLVAAVSYDTPYAVRQHEALRLRHDRGETAKFLERPWRASQRTTAQTIAAEIRKETQ